MGLSRLSRDKQSTNNNKKLTKSFDLQSALKKKVISQLKTSLESMIVKKPPLEKIVDQALQAQSSLVDLKVPG